jgi:hypothetical protein
VDKDGTIKIVSTAPGLKEGEGHSSSSSPNDPRGEEECPAPEEEKEDAHRASSIQSKLTGNILPQDNRDRQHCTKESAMNRTMSFVELGKVMNASWKGCDALARSSVVDDLTEEGLRHYQIQLSEYLEGAGGGGEEAVVVSQQLHRICHGEGEWDGGTK